MADSRIGKRVELHPATDAWMRGDRYGDIVSVSKRERSYLDPRDPRNGRTFTVKMDRSGRTLRVAEGNIARVFDADPCSCAWGGGCARCAGTAKHGGEA